MLKLQKKVFVYFSVNHLRKNKFRGTGGGGRGRELSPPQILKTKLASHLQENFTMTPLSKAFLNSYFE